MYNKIILRQKGKVGVLIPTHSTCIKPLLNTKDEDSEYIQKSCTPVIRKLFVEFNSFVQAWELSHISVKFTKVVQFLTYIIETLHRF